MDLVQRLAKEWAVIAGAPISFALAVLAVGAIVYFVVQLINKAEKDGIKAQRDALKDQKDLAEATSKQLKEESDRLAKELIILKKSSVPPSYEQIADGGPQMVQTLFEIEEKKTTRIVGASQEQINKLALYHRLSEAGAVTLYMYGVSPQTTIVTSTAAATDMVAYIKGKEPK